MVLFLPAVITCPTLSDPTNGIVDVTNNNFESIATYAFDTGYNFAGGSTTRTCGSDGMWSDSDPTCTRKLYYVMIIFDLQSILSPYQISSL